jgi:predicted Zn-dependent protease
LAIALPQGPAELEHIFAEVGRINQYDPTQDYTQQASQALTYRLQQDPNNLDYAYGLALAKVLERDANGAIAALERVVELDANNPFAYAYLAFVHLYNWNPGPAQRALKQARALKPGSTEIQVLSGAASLMQGNVFKAWKYAQALQ